MCRLSSFWTILPLQVSSIWTALLVILITINCACFVVMAGGSSHDIWRERRLTRLSTITVRTTQWWIRPLAQRVPSLPFSHVGTERRPCDHQAATRRYDSGRKIFLDKDDLKQGAEAEYIIDQGQSLSFAANTLRPSMCVS